jgi:hypothetical protein
MPVATPDQSLNGALTVTVNDTGEARGHGAIVIRDDISNTVLVADGTAEASCGDLDDDGFGGLTSLTIGLQDVHTGERSIAIVAPAGGEVDESGRVEAQLVLERGSRSPQVFDGWLQVRFVDQQR